SQGILYKPQNFDSSKLYPLIFNYYEKYSHRLYQLQFPALTQSNVNIPWFGSRGYLVFLADVYYGDGSKTGITSGRYALNAVESAAAVLCKRSYIDSNRLAIQGHSFGGLETNYIFTHSNKFAAAAEGAGFTDVMSSYLTLTGKGMGSVDIDAVQEHKERDHELYGATPWEKPELYLDNSPVWSAHNATAPLLMFHNKKDEQVQWRQGVEMYMALRRLGKPCWMLQYDNSGHILLDRKDALDYTIRLTQFFDHYLKHQPAPRWMTEGIPAKFKQIEDRYELDPKGCCWKNCKECNKPQSLAEASVVH
ncbi:MAG TPA: prolyl oligopeptidase family serine peptidase, partial [Niastella sp.]